MNHQRNILHLAVNHKWEEFQQKYVAHILQRETPLAVGGDGRADTPGHSAKFGSYTMMDLDESLVFDVQLVQVSKFF